MAKKKATRATKKKPATRAAKKKPATRAKKKTAAKKKPTAKKKTVAKKKTAAKKATAKTVPWSRREVEEVRDQLGDVSVNDLKRLDAFLGLFDSNTELSAERSRCVTAVFPDDDATSGDKSFRAFTSRFKKTAASLGLEFRSRKQRGERTVTLVGPDRAAERITRFSREVSQPPDGGLDNPAIPSDTHLDDRRRTTVSLTIVHAPADAALWHGLYDEQLAVQLKASRKFAFDPWDQRKILTGEQTAKELESALQRADMIVVLLSPQLLATPSLTRVLSSALAAERPCALVELRKVDAERQELHGADKRQRFTLGGKAWSQCRSRADKEAFVGGLYRELEAQAERWFSGAVARRRHFEHGVRKLAQLEITCVEDSHAREARLDATSVDATPRSSTPQSALEMLCTWACNPDASPYACVLGEFGMGKTVTLMRLTHELLDRREAGDTSAPIPIFIDLRTTVEAMERGDGSIAVPELEPLLAELLRRAWKHDGPPPTARRVIELVRSEGALIIFDGLDEKLVHLSTPQGHTLIRTLWSILPPRSRGREDKKRGKVAFSCRSHFFPTLRAQNTAFTGGGRDDVRASDYMALVMLPFSREQVESYLTKQLGVARVESAFALIASVHNLSDLAPRPYFLSLIQRHIQQLEELRARGEPVRGVTLYDLLLAESLERDEGKHVLDHDDKQRLMEDVAAALWSSGAREWPWSQLHPWIKQRIQTDKTMQHYFMGRQRTGEAMELLAEDFRTATMVLRPDSSAENFRFAHTSLQEYFLARYLYRALAEGQPERWAMPLPSDETLDFLGQLLTVRTGTERDRWQRTLEGLLENHAPRATRAAFRYWIIAVERDHPTPLPERVVLAGEDLDEWTIAGRRGRPLMLRNADLRDVKLARARLRDVDLTGADLSGVHALSTEFLRVNATRVQLTRGEFTASVWRDSQLVDVSVDHSSWWDAALIGSSTSGEGLDAQSVVDTHHPSPPAISPAHFLGHSSLVEACGFSPNGARIVSASFDGTVRVWDAASGRALLTLEGHTDWVRRCGFSPDGACIVSASDDGTVRVWDAASGRAQLTLKGHAGRVRGCGFSPDGARIVSASDDGTVRVWDAASGRPQLTLEGHTGWVTGCGFSPDGARIVSASDDGTVRLWDVASGRTLLTLEGHTGAVTGCGFSPDGARIVSASDDGTVRLWDAASGRALLILKGHTAWVRGCGFSPDGARIVSASDDRTVRVWDAASGRVLLTLEGHVDWVRGCGFSPDGTRIASASDDRTVRVWDATSGRALLTLEGHQGEVRGCGFSPDGARIVSTSNDRTVRVWDAASGRALLTLEGHANWVRGGEFSPDGARIASASDDGTVRVWDSQTGEQLRIHWCGPERTGATIDVRTNQFLWASPGAWRHLAWRAWDPERNSYRLYPAEIVGRLPD